MQVRAEELEHHRRSTVWLLSGKEWVLIDQSRQVIRAWHSTMKRQRLEMFSRFDWAALFDSIASADMFTPGQFVEMIVAGGSMSAANSKQMSALLQRWDQRNVLLIVAPDTPPSWTGKTAWAKQVEKAGCHVLHPVLDGAALQRWAQGYAACLKMQVEEMALGRLMYLCHGNHAALKQQLDVFALAGTCHIGDNEVRRYAQNQAQFSVFALIDHMFDGQPLEALRICRQLQAAAVTEPLQVLALIAREANLLRTLAEHRAFGLDCAAVFKEARAWPARQRQLLRHAAHRSPNEWRQMTRVLRSIDKQCKGMEYGDPWLSLERLIGAL